MLLSAQRSAWLASGKTSCCVWGGNTRVTDRLLMYQDYFKRSLEFVQIRRFIPKVNDVDFDFFFFFFPSAFTFFSGMFKLGLELPTFSSKVRVC